MKKHIFTLSLMAILAGSLLTSCGPKPGAIDANTAKKRQDSAALNEIYKPYVGTYCGFIKLYNETPANPGQKILPNRCGFTKVPSQEVPVELHVVIIDVQDGVDDNNQPIYKPTMQGLLIRYDIDTSFPTAKMPLFVNYSKDSKTLFLENSNKPNFPNAEAGIVNVFIKNSNPGDQNLLGVSSRGVRFVGRFDVKKISNE